MRPAAYSTSRLCEPENQCLRVVSRERDPQEFAPNSLDSDLCPNLFDSFILESISIKLFKAWIVEQAMGYVLAGLTRIDPFLCLPPD